MAEVGQTLELLISSEENIVADFCWNRVETLENVMLVQGDANALKELKTEMLAVSGECLVVGLAFLT